MRVLYAGLHKATAAELHDQPVRLPGHDQPTGYAIPQAPQVGSINPPPVQAVPAARKAVDRRNAIRAETEAAAAILADVFDVHEPEDVSKATSGDHVEALEPRLAKLLRQPAPAITGMRITTHARLPRAFR